MVYYIVGFRTKDGEFIPWRVCRTAEVALDIASSQRESAHDALYLLRAKVDIMPIEGDD